MSPIGWLEVGESSFLDPDLIYKTLEKVHIIRNHLKTVYSRKKSYADNRKRDLELKVGDWVYLKISPMNGVIRIGNKGKISSRYVVPYKILKRFGK